jgi:thiamine pyrophosphate-dependent acetolactate synthase large subunit-like protein
MSATVADFVVRRLSAWGIERIYGYPGDGINGLMGSLDRASGSMELVRVRHEETAAFMACAHASSRARSASACDGSALPTQGSANPALTIMAVASRFAAAAS